MLTDLSPRPPVVICVGRSVGWSVRKVYCGKTAVNPDAICDDQWGRSRDGCIRWVVIIER